MLTVMTVAVTGTIVGVDVMVAVSRMVLLDCHYVNPLSASSIARRPVANMTPAPETTLLAAVVMMHPPTGESGDDGDSRRRRKGWRSGLLIVNLFH